MSATSTPRNPRAARSVLSRSADLPASRSPKGYRIIRPVRQPATEAPTPGRLRGLWQRLRAALRVTPEQWHAYEMARRAGSGAGGLRAGMGLGGQIALVSPSAPAALRRPPQPDLP